MVGGCDFCDVGFVVVEVMRAKNDISTWIVSACSYVSARIRVRHVTPDTIASRRLPREIFAIRVHVIYMLIRIPAILLPEGCNVPSTSRGPICCSEGMGNNIGLSYEYVVHCTATSTQSLVDIPTFTVHDRRVIRHKLPKMSPYSFTNQPPPASLPS